MEAIGLALSFLDDVDTLVGVLEDLGAMHVVHGIQDAHFEVLHKRSFNTVIYVSYLF